MSYFGVPLTVRAMIYACNFIATYVALYEATWILMFPFSRALDNIW